VCFWKIIDQIRKERTIIILGRAKSDAVAAMRILTEQIQQQHKAVDSAKIALDLEKRRYETGIDPYINVVTEQNALLIAQLILAQIEILRMTTSVSLIEALGGGWDSSQLPSPQQVTAKPPKPDRVQK